MQCKAGQVNAFNVPCKAATFHLRFFWKHVWLFAGVAIVSYVLSDGWKVAAIKNSLTLRTNDPFYFPLF